MNPNVKNEWFNFDSYRNLPWFSPSWDNVEICTLISSCEELTQKRASYQWDCVHEKFYKTMLRMQRWEKDGPYMWDSLMCIPFEISPMRNTIWGDVEVLKKFTWKLNLRGIWREKRRRLIKFVSFNKNRSKFLQTSHCSSKVIWLDQRDLEMAGIEPEQQDDYESITAAPTSCQQVSGESRKCPKPSPHQRVHRTVSTEVEYIIEKGKGFDEKSKPVFVKICQRWRAKAAASKSLREKEGFWQFKIVGTQLQETRLRLYWFE